MTRLRLAVLWLGLAAASVLTSPAMATDDNPTPYDPNDVSKVNMTRSSSRYFVLDAQLPAEFQHALDDRKFISITNFSLGASNTSFLNLDSTISVKDITLMQQPSLICSAYDSKACFNVGKFYTSRAPQANVIGVFALDGSTMLQWGINTGYDAEKLTVTPSLMLGLAKRFYVSDARDKHIIVEASEWIGGSVKHRPCTDDYSRQYYCGALTSWSDFTYDSHPQSAFVKVTLESLF